MEKYKRIGKTLLFPNKIIVMILFPLAMLFLISAMLYFGMEHIVSYISYAVSFYSLIIVCFRIPEIILFLKKLKKSKN